KDLAHLIHFGKQHKCKLPILEATQQINDTGVDRFVNMIEKKLGGCKGKTIGIWGLSFKPNTDDFRDSRSLKIIAKLLEKGALIKAHDPITIPAARK
ncbi:UDP binding domain-containing protein, partial [Klebsiella pneumoniae]|uniref:UDP binding domain-containing protein n=1 Tax=Klebsiella pneumoniae TaxID=573 RepID=UPI00385293C6